VVIELDGLFSGYQPFQVSVLNRHFTDHFGHHHQIPEFLKSIITSDETWV